MDTRTGKGRKYMLERATPLFARLGYNGVSMRDLARVVGVTPAALYYHFKNKDELYIAAISKVFDNKINEARTIIASHPEPVKQLEMFIDWFVRCLKKDSDFRKFLQWFLLDGDEKRLRMIKRSTFKELFNTVGQLGESFKQQYDPRLFTVSLIGLVLYHSENGLAGTGWSINEPGTDEAGKISRHIASLLEHGLTGQ